MTAVRSQLRRVARRTLLDLTRRILESEEGRDLLARSLNGTLAWRPPLPATAGNRCQPYSDLGIPRPSPSSRGGPIIVTARFRTGSTLLWNIFRNLPGLTAYYEPFNQRRWFDPASWNGRIDPTHRFVDNYWREYMCLPELAEHFRDQWPEHQLLMDANAWDPAMQRFIEILVERASGRAVLQFNQIDFRLPWFRAHFPEARLVHLYRHPRDQWCSSLLDLANVPENATIAEFAEHDEFYLLAWVRDLKHRFPFLDEAEVTHPYELFYYVWKLSYLFGIEYADHSLSFEDLVGHPRRELTRLSHAVDLEIAEVDIDRVIALIEPRPPGKWRGYASDEWFRQRESVCEAVLADFFAGQPG